MSQPGAVMAGTKLMSFEPLLRRGGEGERNTRMKHANALLARTSTSHVPAWGCSGMHEAKVFRALTASQG